MKERVTVSIPYFQCKPYILKAVESILRQNYANLKVVVVNDGDEDPPWDQLAHIDDPRLVRFDLESNHGRYFADAVVLNATAEPYFLTQDADDWSEPNRISVLLQKLQSDNADGAISASCQYRIENGVITKNRISGFSALKRPLTKAFWHRANHLGLFRTQVLKNIGGYFGGFRIGYDTLIVNLLLMMGSISYVDEPLYNVLLRPKSLTHCGATGKGSSARREVTEQVQQMYDEAFELYTRYLSGDIEKETLARCIRQICKRHITHAQHEAMQQASNRLRSILNTPQEPPRLQLQEKERPHAEATNPAKKPFYPQNGERTMGHLIRDPRLTWNAWTIGKRLAIELTRRLEEIKPRRILEVGSGTSTVFLVHYAAQNSAKVVSLEHKEHYYEKTRCLLTEMGLVDFVELRLAPLILMRVAKGSNYPWYHTELKGKFDFVFVDGPPIKYGRQAVLFALSDHLDTNWELWLKDGKRQHETACVELWRKHFQFSSRLSHIDYRGVWILHNKLKNKPSRPQPTRLARNGEFPIDHLLNDQRLMWNAWTIGKRLAIELTKRLEEIKPRRILEVGSGTSTVFLAHYAAQNSAKVVSLEHKEHYYEKTRCLLTEMGLVDFVELRLAPLISMRVASGLSYPWYHTDLEGKFEFVFVDGPPLKWGRQAALFALSDHLDASWEIWLEDGKREHEKACVELWKKHFQFSSTLSNIDYRGVWILRN